MGVAMIREMKMTAVNLTKRLRCATMGVMP